jgi:hypothetical protein
MTCWKSALLPRLGYRLSFYKRQCLELKLESEWPSKIIKYCYKISNGKFFFFAYLNPYQHDIIKVIT